MKVLLLGSTGHLGFHLLRQLDILSSLQVTTFTRDQINKFLLTHYKLSYDIIINCSAIVGHRAASSYSLHSLFQVNTLLPYLLVNNSEP